MEVNLKEKLVLIAEEQMLGYDQLKGYFRENGWFLIKIVSNVKTITGVHFLEGDITIAHYGQDASVPFQLRNVLFAWSYRTKSEKAIRPKDYVLLSKSL